MHSSFHTEICTPNHFTRIIHCQTRVVNELACSDLYYPSQPNELMALFQNMPSEGFILGVYSLEELIGFSSVERCTDSYYGYPCNVNKKYYSIEDTVVLSEYRGNGAQKLMWKHIIDLLPENATLLCTIHPENIFSMRNALSLGFKTKKLVKLYKNSPRLILERVGF